MGSSKLNSHECQIFRYEEIEKLARKHGNSFLVFWEQKLKANYEDLKKAFEANWGKTRIGYSYKTNYMPVICRKIDLMGGYAEVVSEMEIYLARKIGVKWNRIIFNGPAKTPKSIRSVAVNGGLVQIDNMRDLVILDELAKSASKTIKIGLRISVDIGNGHSRFGIDTKSPEFLEILTVIKRNNNLSLSGIHCHMPDRSLESFRRRMEEIVVIIKGSTELINIEYLNIGGGFMSKMPKELMDTLGVQCASFADYAAVIGKALDESKINRTIELIIEPGTAVVADTMKYYTRIMTKKSINGKNIAIADGSVFDFSAMSRDNRLPMEIYSSNAPEALRQEVWSVVGYTCIEKDIISNNYLGKINVGDFAEISNVGSYSNVMKPPFIKAAPTILVIREDGGKIEVARKKERFSDIFRNYI